MSLADKIRRLLHPDSRASFAAGFKRIAYTPNYRRFIGLIDEAGIAMIKEKHYRPGENPSKYLDTNEWMKANAKRLGDLLIREAPPRLRILDIGCGAGYFLFMAQHMGHAVVGTDMKNIEFYNDMIELLKVPRVVHTVRAFEKMPEEMTGYDVIASHMTCFNRRPDKSHWGAEEWTFFVDDMKQRLNTGGIIQFHLNRLDDGRAMEPDVNVFFRQAGFKVDRSRVMFRSV